MATGLPDEIHDELEQKIYEAAVIPDLWPEVLVRLGEISNSAGGGIAVINERGVHLTASPNMLEVVRKIEAEGYMDRSGRARGVVAKGLVGVPRFLNEFDYYEPGQENIDPIVTEVFRPAGFGWAAGWLQQLPHGDLAVFNVEQYADRGPIQGEDLARLDSLYSPLARAVMLSGRSDFQRVRTAIETLTAVGLPAAALTPTGRVVIANPSFAAATHVWTTRGGDRIGLDDRVADTMLHDALAAVELARGPRSIPVRAVAGGPVTSVVQIVPIRRSANDIFGSTVAIAILSEPKAEGVGATLIQSLFDLTPAEISVARGIAAGQTVAQIAQTSGRSASTVRNQLKSAMAKTGSSRQVELALLMRQLGGGAP